LRENSSLTNFVKKFIDLFIGFYIV